MPVKMAASENLKENTNKNETVHPMKVKSTILDSFTSLGDGNVNNRVKSGMDLIRHLSKVEKDDNEVKYAIQRLIRGSGAAKCSTKSGYYSALVALLTSTAVDVDTIFECVKKELQTSGSNSKSENADISMGQILVCGALIRSGIFAKCDVKQQKTIVEYLLVAGKKRSYLTLATCSFISSLFENVDEQKFVAVLWPMLKSEIAKPWVEVSVDSLYLLILAKRKYPGIISNRSLAKSTGYPDIITEETVKCICQLLLNIPIISSLHHPVYEAIGKELANSEHLIKFTSEMDTHLTKWNRNKYLAATTLLKGILQNLRGTANLPELLTNNFIAQTLNNFRALRDKEKDVEFHKKVTEIFALISGILKRGEVNSEIKLCVIKKMISHPGNFQFTRITNSKLVQQITLGLDKGGVENLAEFYKQVIAAESEKVVGAGATEPWVKVDRILAGQLLVKLLAHTSVQNETEWIVEQLKFMLSLSILKDERYSNVGVELAAALKESFFRALDLKSFKLQQLQNLLSQIVHHLAYKMNPENHQKTLRTAVTQETLETWEKTVKLVKKLEKTDHKAKTNPLTSVFLTLFLQMGLQIFNEQELAANSLNELFSCYERVKGSKKSEIADDLEWIEVVVDLFLSLLSHNSHLLRSLVGRVFPYLCEHLTASAVHQILSVLDPKNESNPLSGPNESDSSDGSDEETGSSDDSDPEENETVNDKLRIAVRQALHSSGYQTDDESVDIDQMSETEGEKLDTALADAFKRFKPNRTHTKKQSNSDKTLTHFRVRVLDLIDVYLDSQPSMILCFEMMSPLLQTLEFSIRDEHQKPLRDRVRSCLKKLTSLKKFSGTDDVNAGVLCDLFKSLLDKGSRSAFILQDMTEEVTDCCVFIIRCSQVIVSCDAVPKKSKKLVKCEIKGAIKNVSDAYFKKGDAVASYVLLKHVVQMQWDDNAFLAVSLFEYAFDGEIRSFSRQQALDLLRLFYMNARLLKSNREQYQLEVAEHETKFLDDAVNFLKNTENAEKITDKYICNLFLLLRAMKLSPLKNAAINWKQLGDAAQNYRSHAKFSNDGKKAYGKFCKSLGIPNLPKRNCEIGLNVLAEELEQNTSTEDFGADSQVVTNDIKKCGDGFEDVEMAANNKPEKILDQQSFSSKKKNKNRANDEIIQGTRETPMENIIASHEKLAEDVTKVKLKKKKNKDALEQTPKEKIVTIEAKNMSDLNETVPHNELTDKKCKKRRSGVDNIEIEANLTGSDKEANNKLEKIVEQLSVSPKKSKKNRDSVNGEIIQDTLENITKNHQKLVEDVRKVKCEKKKNEDASESTPKGKIDLIESKNMLDLLRNEITDKKSKKRRSGVDNIEIEANLTGSNKGANNKPEKILEQLSVSPKKSKKNRHSVNGEIIHDTLENITKNHQKLVEDVTKVKFEKKKNKDASESTPKGKIDLIESKNMLDLFRNEITDKKSKKRRSSVDNIEIEANLTGSNKGANNKPEKILEQLSVSPKKSKKNRHSVNGEIIHDTLENINKNHQKLVEDVTKVKFEKKKNKDASDLTPKGKIELIESKNMLDLVRNEITDKKSKMRRSGVDNIEIEANLTGSNKGANNKPENVVDQLLVSPRKSKKSKNGDEIIHDTPENITINHQKLVEDVTKVKLEKKKNNDILESTPEGKIDDIEANETVLCNEKTDKKGKKRRSRLEDIEIGANFTGSSKGANNKPEKILDQLPVSQKKSNKNRNSVNNAIIQDTLENITINHQKLVEDVTKAKLNKKKSEGVFESTPKEKIDSIEAKNMLDLNETFVHDAVLAGTDKKSKRNLEASKLDSKIIKSKKEKRKTCTETGDCDISKNLGDLGTEIEKKKKRNSHSAGNDEIKAVSHDHEMKDEAKMSKDKKSASALGLNDTGKEMGSKKRKNKSTRDLVGTNSMGSEVLEIVETKSGKNKSVDEISELEEKKSKKKKNASILFGNETFLNESSEVEIVKKSKKSKNRSFTGAGDVGPSSEFQIIATKASKT